MFYKKRFLEHFAIFRGKNLSQSLFLSCNFIKKETLAQGFSCEFCKIFKNTFFRTPLGGCFYFTTAVDVILCNYIKLATFKDWKLIGREKTFIHKSQGFYRFRFLFLFLFFSFSLSNACLPCRLRKAYAVLWAANRFVGSETP